MTKPLEKRKRDGGSGWREVCGWREKAGEPRGDASDAFTTWRETPAFEMWRERSEEDDASWREKALTEESGSPRKRRRAMRALAGVGNKRRISTKKEKEWSVH